MKEQKPITYGSPEFRKAAERREGFQQHEADRRSEVESELVRYFARMREAEKKAFTKPFRVG